MPASVGETDSGIHKDTSSDKRAPQGERLMKVPSKGKSKPGRRPVTATGSNGEAGRGKPVPAGNRQQRSLRGQSFAAASPAAPVRKQFTENLLRLRDCDSVTQQEVLAFVRSSNESFQQGSPLNAAAQTQHSMATTLREHPQVRADAEAVVAAETAASSEPFDGYPMTKRSVLKLSVEGKSHDGLPQETLNTILRARVTTTQPWSRGSSAGKSARKYLNVVIMKSLRQHQRAAPEPVEEGEVLASDTTDDTVDDAVLLRQSLQGSLCPADLSEDLVVEVPVGQAEVLLRGRQSCVVTTSDGLRIHVDLIPDPASEVVVSVTGVGREVSGALLLAKLAEIVVATGGDSRIFLVATGSTVTLTAGIACEAEVLADELGMRRKAAVSAPVLPRGIDKRCYLLTCTHRTAVLLPDTVTWQLRQPDGSEVIDRVQIRRPRGCNRSLFSLRERHVSSCTAILPLPQPASKSSQASGPSAGVRTPSSGSQQPTSSRDEGLSPGVSHSQPQFVQATGNRRKDARAIAHPDRQQKPQPTVHPQLTVSDENNRFSILKSPRAETADSGASGVSGPSDVEASAFESMPPPAPRSRSRGRRSLKSGEQVQDRVTTPSKRSRAGAGGDRAQPKRSCSASRSASRARHIESPTTTTARSGESDSEVDLDTQLALDRSRAEEAERVALAAKEHLQVQQVLTRSAREAAGQASAKLSRTPQLLARHADLPPDSDQQESADQMQLNDMPSADATRSGCEVTVASTVQTPPSESPSTEGTQLQGPDPSISQS